MAGTGAVGLGIDFELVQHAEFIDQRASTMLWETAIACTCAVNDTYAGLIDDGKARRTDPSCPRCNGIGFLYRAPRTVRGMVTSMKSQRNMLAAGYGTPGDMVFSPQFYANPQCTGSLSLSSYDKLTATWAQSVDEGQVIVRGAANMGENAALQTDINPDEDRLWYEPTEAVWCEDEYGTQYTEHVDQKQTGDFILGPGRLVRWVRNQPPVGTRYSIKYRAYLEWIVFVPPQERLDRDGINLGQLVLLRRRNVAFVHESPRISAQDRVSLQSRMAC